MSRAKLELVVIDLEEAYDLVEAYVCQLVVVKHDVGNLDVQALYGNFERVYLLQTYFHVMKVNCVSNNVAEKWQSFVYVK